MVKGSTQTVLMTVLVIAVIGIGAYLFMNGTPIAKTIITEGGTKDIGSVGCSDVQCETTPAYAYSAFDKFSTTVVGGTDQIKANGNKPVSSLASPSKCDVLQYWKNNGTYYCEIVTEPSVKCSSNQVQTTCYNNASSVTLKLYDLNNAVFLSDGGADSSPNLTMGANAVANLEFQYQGTSKAASAPFGGCIVLEYPSTIISATLKGSGIENNACPYPLTYTVSSTSNTYRAIELPKGWDGSNVADLKKASVQLQSGATNPSGTGYVKIIPANYYVTNDGEFALGVEKDKNQDTTRVGLNTPTFTYIIE